MQQTVPITFDNPDPDNWEGHEYRRVKPGEFHLNKGRIELWEFKQGSASEYLVMRRKQSPIEKWIADHPWIPEGRWVYRFSSNRWFISDKKPESDGDCGVTYSASLDAHSFQADELAAFLGHTFTPPPVNLIEIKRTEQ